MQRVACDVIPPRRQQHARAWMLRRQRWDARVSDGCGLLFLKLEMSRRSQLIIQEQDVLELQQSVTELAKTFNCFIQFQRSHFFYISYNILEFWSTDEERFLKFLYKISSFVICSLIDSVNSIVCLTRPTFFF